MNSQDKQKLVASLVTYEVRRLQIELQEFTPKIEKGYTSEINAFAEDLINIALRMKATALVSERIYTEGCIK